MVGNGRSDSCTKNSQGKAGMTGHANFATVFGSENAEVKECEYCNDHICRK